MGNKKKRKSKWKGYFFDDCDCTVCKYYQDKKKGCKLDKCCCEDEKIDALAKGRISRKEG